MSIQVVRFIDTIIDRIITHLVDSRQKMPRVIRDIWHQQGIRGFYRGYFVSLATHMPSSAIWWGFYGALCPRIYNAGRRHVQTDTPPEASSKLLVLSQALAGGISGVITATLTNPMDIVRTRYIYSKKCVN